MALSIRDATGDDADAVAGLLGELGYPSTREAAAGHIGRFRETSGSTMQLAVDRGEIVGLIATHLVPRMDDDRFSCRITDIVVADVARRQGVGTALLAAAEQTARAAGAPRLDLASGAWRAEAHAFYTAHGFETRASAFAKRLP